MISSVCVNKNLIQQMQTFFLLWLVSVNQFLYLRIKFPSQNES